MKLYLGGEPLKIDTHSVGMNLGMDLSMPRSKQLDKKIAATKASASDGVVTVKKYDTDKFDDKTIEKLRTIDSIVEQEQNRDRVGERILNKAESGEKLTAKEMKYLAEKYPEMYEKYKKAEMEREALKQQLKAARNSVQAAQAYSDATMRAIKTSEGDGELRMRTGQLREEYNDYLKTNGYKKKKANEDDEENKSIAVKAMEVEGQLAAEGKTSSFGGKVDYKA